ncbi:MAG: PilZ domain-containing protein [Candidatus Omnitrophota bacterium]
MLDERRKYKRVSGRLRIIYKIAGDAVEGSAYSVDVSAGGFCLGLDRHIKADTELELLVYLPDNEKPFSCSGKVTWQKTQGIKGKNGKFYYDTGLRFDSLDLKNRLRLIYYVHTKLKTTGNEEKNKP